MKIAIMQPYLFPYIGYFQLINSTDLFLIYDDVNFIKQGYINRNNILTANGKARITFPVQSVSSNKLIKELSYSERTEKPLKTIEQSYSKAPYYNSIFPLIKETLETNDRAIADTCLKSYKLIFAYLGIDKKLIKTSEIEYDRERPAQDRLIELCHKFNAKTYINASGGRELYKKEDFLREGIELKFINTLPIKYQQGNNDFIPNLSIIDILMNCSKKDTLELINKFELN